jgi:hypothetical protein
MECKQVEENISQYIENDISKDLHNKISLHLDECDPCRALKIEIELLMGSFPELEEDVPFFLKNRLYYIPDSTENTKKESVFYLKWVAAAIGTFVLFINLFYFSNIYPPANRALHSIVSEIETLAVQTEALFEKIKESKDLLMYTFLKSKSEDPDELQDDNKKKKGGKNGSPT